MIFTQLKRFLYFRFWKRLGTKKRNESKRNGNVPEPSEIWETKKSFPLSLPHSRFKNRSNQVFFKFKFADELVWLYAPWKCFIIASGISLTQHFTIFFHPSFNARNGPLNLGTGYTLKVKNNYSEAWMISLPICVIFFYFFKT